MRLPLTRTSTGGDAAGAGQSEYGSDSGSAVVWVIAFSALLLLVAVGVGVRTTAVLARHRAESAADLAALAAATRIGVSTDECATARTIGAANGAQVSACQLNLAPDGRSGSVRVEVQLRVVLGLGVGPQLVTASARAARLAASGG
ncbi:helicase/secretion neighborhood TadE-like protein [Frankineae bacterium MT45]|nr:helicase/secretion neighborhood TadE-like protein [Frankineae bacterium MT45]